MNYYGLYDYDLKGFKANYAGNNLVDLVNESAERIIYLSQCDEEPLTYDIHPIDVLEMYNYGVRIITESDYNKINQSDELFLSRVVDNISEGISFDWVKEYLEHANNHGLFNREDYISVQLILDYLYKAYEEYEKTDQITNDLLNENNCYLKDSIKKNIDALEKVIIMHKKEIRDRCSVLD